MQNQIISKTAIVILNYNNFEDTINCIKSVEQYNTAPIKYIIVDNGSKCSNAVDEIRLFLESSFSQEQYLVIGENEKEKVSYPLPYVTFYVSKTNDGYAKGNNKGLEFAYKDEEIESILILNNDVLFVQDIIPGLKDYYYNVLKDVGIISPILYTKNCEGIDFNCARKDTNIYIEICKNFFYYTLKLLRIDINKRRYIISGSKNLSIIIPIELPSGSCMFIDKYLFKSIDFFDSNTFLYYEENILYAKIKSLQRKNYLLTNLRCIHLGANSTSKVSSLFILDCGANSLLHYMSCYVKHNSILIYCLKFALFYHRNMFKFQKIIMGKNFKNI